MVISSTSRQGPGATDNQNQINDSQKLLSEPDTGFGADGLSMDKGRKRDEPSLNSEFISANTMFTSVYDDKVNLGSDVFDGCETGSDSMTYNTDGETYTTDGDTYGGFTYATDGDTYNTGRHTYDTGRDTYDTGRETYDSGRHTYDTGRDTYDTGRNTYNTRRVTYATDGDTYISDGETYSDGDGETYDDTYSRADDTYSRADDTYSRGDDTYSRADETYSRADETYSRADETYSREGETYNEERTYGGAETDSETSFLDVQTRDDVDMDSDDFKYVEGENTNAYDADRYIETVMLADDTGDSERRSKSSSASHHAASVSATGESKLPGGVRSDDVLIEERKSKEPENFQAIDAEKRNSNIEDEVIKNVMKSGPLPVVKKLSSGKPSRLGDKRTIEAETKKIVKEGDGAADESSSNGAVKIRDMPLTQDEASIVSGEIELEPGMISTSPKVSQNKIDVTDAHYAERATCGLSQIISMCFGGSTVRSGAKAISEDNPQTNESQKERNPGSFDPHEASNIKVQLSPNENERKAMVDPKSQEETIEPKPHGVIPEAKTPEKTNDTKIPEDISGRNNVEDTTKLKTLKDTETQKDVENEAGEQGVSSVKQEESDKENNDSNANVRGEKVLSAPERSVEPDLSSKNVPLALTSQKPTISSWSKFVEKTRNEQSADEVVGWSGGRSHTIKSKDDRSRGMTSASTHERSSQGYSSRDNSMPSNIDVFMASKEATGSISQNLSTVSVDISTITSRQMVLGTVDEDSFDESEDMSISRLSRYSRASGWDKFISSAGSRKGNAPSSLQNPEEDRTGKNKRHEPSVEGSKSSQSNKYLLGKVRSLNKSKVKSPKKELTPRSAPRDGHRNDESFYELGISFERAMTSTLRATNANE